MSIATNGVFDLHLVGAASGSMGAAITTISSAGVVTLRFKRLKLTVGELVKFVQSGHLCGQEVPPFGVGQPQISTDFSALGKPRLTERQVRDKSLSRFRLPFVVGLAARQRKSNNVVCRPAFVDYHDVFIHEQTRRLPRSRFSCFHLCLPIVCTRDRSQSVSPPQPAMTTKYLEALGLE
ncbi:MAG: hypothetical protein ACXWDN_09920 [Limisphaerales bacterium]